VIDFALDEPLTDLRQTSAGDAVGRTTAGALAVDLDDALVRQPPQFGVNLGVLGRPDRAATSRAATPTP
jgi:hypothetical protein